MKTIFKYLQNAFEIAARQRAARSGYARYDRRVGGQRSVDSLSFRAPSDRLHL